MRARSARGLTARVDRASRSTSCASCRRPTRNRKRRPRTSRRFSCAGTPERTEGRLKHYGIANFGWLVLIQKSHSKIYIYLPSTSFCASDRPHISLPITLTEELIRQLVPEGRTQSSFPEAMSAPLPSAASVRTAGCTTQPH